MRGCNDFLKGNNHGCAETPGRKELQLVESTLEWITWGEKSPILWCRQTVWSMPFGVTRSNPNQLGFWAFVKFDSESVKITYQLFWENGRNEIFLTITLSSEETYLNKVVMAFYVLRADINCPWPAHEIGGLPMDSRWVMAFAKGRVLSKNPIYHLNYNLKWRPVIASCLYLYSPWVNSNWNFRQLLSRNYYSNNKRIHNPTLMK